ncbi:uncharacterized protein N7482_007024 [Penicillium canariense]|uniref:Fe2OG dioxygenase domain-containing protein n=1 Tax=Penicillium canariense TaxID=189055 RepID=A0A9W9HYS3_9EURO|nr:uncharacterized protein N7482_007024 [Penicillium canariense]KAJ5160020.1 hypothetical protein N7482_007024 [Penicillium canariense]
MTTVSTLTTTIVLEGEKAQSVSLETVKYADILQQDALETSKLLRACQSPGFFYLDLSGVNAQFNGDAYLENIQLLHQQQEEYFHLPFHAKMKDYLESSAKKGYQYFPDCEAFEVPYNSSRADDIPSPLNPQSVCQVMAHTHAIAVTLIRCLSPFIGNEDIRKYVRSIHDDRDVSLSGMRLENILAAETGGCIHSSGNTDKGSMTLRHCDEVIIEYLDAETGRWVYIEPHQGCLIVNVADLLQTASHGLFQSPLHRVGHPMVGTQARRCLAYHLWPSDNYVMDL